MNFDKEAKFDKKNLGEGGRGGTETKTVCQTVSNEVNTKMQLSTQCMWYNQHFKICYYLFKDKPYNFNTELSSK